MNEVTDRIFSAVCCCCCALFMAVLTWLIAFVRAPTDRDAVLRHSTAGPWQPFVGSLVLFMLVGIVAWFVALCLADAKEDQAFGLPLGASVCTALFVTLLYACG